MPITTYLGTPYKEVKINGVSIPGVLSTSTRHGFDIATAEASIEVAVVPTVSPWDEVEIIEGWSQSVATRRFIGYYMGKRRELEPPMTTLSCKGKLAKVDAFIMPDRYGIDLTGSYWDHHGNPDEEYIRVILELCGFPRVEVDAFDIQGTGVTMGVDPNTAPYNIAWGGAFHWKFMESGRTWVQNFDAICKGYRTYDHPTLGICRHLISAIPSGSPDVTFEGGVDIFRGSAEDSFIEGKNLITVMGRDDGIDEDLHAYEHHKHYECWADNPYFEYVPIYSSFEVHGLIHEISSPMLLRSFTSDPNPGLGLSCQEVGEWALTEYNVHRIKSQVETPRNDLLIPGMTIRINSPNRLGLTNQLFWLQSVSTQIDRTNRWLQTLELIGVIPFPV